LKSFDDLYLLNVVDDYLVYYNNTEIILIAIDDQIESTIKTTKMIKFSREFDKALFDAVTKILRRYRSSYANNTRDIKINEYRCILYATLVKTPKSTYLITHEYYSYLKDSIFCIYDFFKRELTFKISLSKSFKMFDSRYINTHLFYLDDTNQFVFCSTNYKNKNAILFFLNYTY
jgi:hypothetical protein